MALASYQGMLTFDPVRKMMVQMPAPVAAAPAVAAKADEGDFFDQLLDFITPARSSSAVVQAGKPVEEESFFQHMWDVVNPLQHLPIIGTIYRAATGERLDAVEKIAGDALYGGLWGAVTAVASVAFEGITGKSVEDTVLAWFDGEDEPSRVAASTITPSPFLPSGELPALPYVTLAQAAPDTLELLALTGALSAKGVSSDTANRALYAYRRSMDMTAPYTPVISSLN